MRDHLPLYVDRVRAKGRDYFYFRHAGKRTRLPGKPGEPEFHRAYADLLSLVKAGPRRHGQGTIAHLIRAFEASPEFKSLKPKSQRDYSRQFTHLDTVGTFPAADIRRAHILALRDKLADKPRTADYFVQAVSVLFTWGIDREFTRENPAAKIKRIARSKSYLAWTAEDCARFEASDPPWPMRRAYFLGRYIGARRGDVIALTRADFDGQRITFEPGKTERHRESAAISVPAHPRLIAELADTPVASLMLAPTETGAAWQARSFSSEFRKALSAAGLERLHFHGLRHTVGRELAEAGASDAEIQAVTGHKSRAMVERYTRQARQRTLADAAIHRLKPNKNRT